MRALRYSFLSIAILSSAGAFAQLSISAQQSAQQIASAITGSFVTITNPVLSCPDSASGTFIAGPGSANLGMTDGALLTTGRAKTNGLYIGTDAPQSNFASQWNNSPGDPDINTLTGALSYDACVFECDVKAAYDSLMFEYVFGSEEYANFSCSPFNDAFAFFLSGPGIVGSENLALIPGTNIPVAINSTTDVSLNPPMLLSYCQNMGPGSPFSQYYNDNSLDSTVVYHGLTKVMRSFRRVDTTVTYHLKFVIADVQDGVLDGGVFIKGHSVTSKPTGGFPPVGMIDVKKAPVSVSPNPFSSAVAITLPVDWQAQEITASLSDGIGRIVYRFSGKGSNLSAHFEAVSTRLPAGPYLLHTSCPQLGVTDVQKLQKK